MKLLLIYAFSAPAIAAIMNHSIQPAGSDIQGRVPQDDPAVIKCKNSCVEDVFNCTTKCEDSDKNVS